MPLVIPRMFSFLFRFKSNSCKKLIDNIKKYILTIQDLSLTCISLPLNPFIFNIKTKIIHRQKLNEITWVWNSVLIFMVWIFSFIDLSSTYFYHFYQLIFLNLIIFFLFFFSHKKIRTRWRRINNGYYWNYSLEWSLLFEMF